MTQKRYGKLYTPGQQTLGPPEIVRHKPEVASDYKKLQTRRRELQARLQQANAELSQITINLGAMVAEGCDYAEYLDRLAGLRLEVEALKAGIVHLDDKAARLKISNSWLK